MDDQFHPPRPYQNPHIQTILSSSRLRALGTNFLTKISQPLLIDAGQGIRLSGFYSRQSHPKQARGTVALLHGWEGSSASAYILSLGKYLYRKGYDIFRLNLRDHGDSHGLNEALFHGALTDEIVTATQEIAKLSADKPFYLIGFSLGGNYALRVALRHRNGNIANLRHVIAVSPALDPLKSTRCIDNNVALYRHYFLRKWKKSLRKKAVLYPHRYDFRNLMQYKSCMALTEAIMPYYPDFPDYRDYFQRYTLLGNIFAALTVPVTIVISRDDPVVPADDFDNLAPHPLLTLYIHRYGGHCGFFESFPFACWYERKAYDILESGLLTEP